MSGVVRESDLAKMDGFLDEFMRTGGGILEIAVVENGVNALDAIKQANAIRKHALKRGLRRSEIVVKVRRLDDATVSGPIVLSFESYRVNIPKCGDFSQGTSYNPENILHRNFGCSIQTAIAAMVSNPADLERPRTRRPADTARHNLVLQHYRGGEATEAERGESEEAESIRELSQ